MEYQKDFWNRQQILDLGRIIRPHVYAYIYVHNVIPIAVYYIFFFFAKIYIWYREMEYSTYRTENIIKWIREKLFRESLSSKLSS